MNLASRWGFQRGRSNPFGQGWSKCPTREGKACSARFAAAEFTAESAAGGSRSSWLTNTDGLQQSKRALL